MLQERAKAGVEIRVIGKVEKSADGVEARKLPDLRLHVRAIVRDGTTAFIGSQSLRKLELDGRREVGVIINDSRDREEDAGGLRVRLGSSAAPAKLAPRRQRQGKGQRQGRRKTRLKASPTRYCAVPALDDARSRSRSARSARWR